MPNPLQLFSLKKAVAPPKVKPQSQMFALEPINLPEPLAKQLALLKKSESVPGSSYKIQFTWQTGLFQEFQIKVGRFPFLVTILKCPTLGDVMVVKIRRAGMTETTKHVVIRWRFDIIDTDYKHEQQAVMNRDGSECEGDEFKQVIAPAHENQLIVMYLTTMAVIYP